MNDHEGDSVQADMNSGYRWYALQLRSRYEKKTHAELLGKGVDSFLPLIEETHIWSDRKKKVWEPLFRGYLFVRMDLKNTLDVLQTPGVVRFVANRGHPSSIPEKQIEWVRLLVGKPVRAERAPYVREGEYVEVTAGILKGVRGFVTKVKGATRLVVSVDAIAQAVSVEVPAGFVQKVLQEQGS